MLPDIPRILLAVDVAIGLLSIYIGSHQSLSKPRACVSSWSSSRLLRFLTTRSVQRQRLSGCRVGSWPLAATACCTVAKPSAQVLRPFSE